MRENLEPESNTALKEDTSLNQSDQTNTANTISSVFVRTLTTFYYLVLWNAWFWLVSNSK